MTFLSNWLTRQYYYTRQHGIHTVEMFFTSPKDNNKISLCNLSAKDFGDFDQTKIYTFKDRSHQFAPSTIIDIDRLRIGSLHFAREAITINSTNTNSSEESEDGLTLHQNLNLIRIAMRTEDNFTLFSQYFNQTPFNQLTRYIADDLSNQHKIVVIPDGSTRLRKFIFFFGPHPKLTKIYIEMIGTFKIITFPGSITAYTVEELGPIGNYKASCMIQLKDMTAKADYQWQLSNAVIKKIAQADNANQLADVKFAKSR